MSPTLPATPGRPVSPVITPTPPDAASPAADQTPAVDHTAVEYAIQLADGTLLPGTQAKFPGIPFLTPDQTHAALACKAEGDKLAALGVPTDYWPKVVRRTWTTAVSEWTPDV